MFGKVRYILFGATTLLKIKLIDTPVRERLCTINNTVTLTPVFFYCFSPFANPADPPLYNPLTATAPLRPPPAVHGRCSIAECDKADGIRDVDILITAHKKQPVICTRGKVKRIIRSKNVLFQRRYCYIIVFSPLLLLLYTW